MKLLNGINKDAFKTRVKEVLFLGVVIFIGIIISNLVGV